MALLASIIGAGAALAAQHTQLKGARAADSERERKHAIEEIIVRAQAIDLRVHEMMVLTANGGSLNGLLGRILGAVVPLDYSAMFNTLNVEVDALNRAAAQVWLFGEDDTVALANAVSLAATDVIDAHTRASENRIASLLRVAIFGRLDQDAQKIQTARRALSRARRDLVEHTRLKLGLEDVDLFALPADQSQ